MAHEEFDAWLPLAGDLFVAIPVAGLSLVAWAQAAAFLLAGMVHR